MASIFKFILFISFICEMNGCERLNLETAVRDGKVMQGFEPESLTTGGAHSQKVKGPPVVRDSGSKDCVKLPSPTAVSRFISGALKCTPPADGGFRWLGVDPALEGRGIL